MSSKDGRISIVFNGEIYNYKELRDELQCRGFIFSSDSDTEVLLAAWQHWGEGALERLTGMFAFAVFDRVKHKLSLARDPFGIKPLFYCQTEDSFLFASEQRALWELRKQRLRPDLQVAYDYLVHGDYDSSEATFVKGIRQMPPATWMEVDPGDTMRGQPVKWWRPQIAETFQGSFDQAVEAVREKFLQSVKLHLRSDVSLGVALSGGLDSTAVLCAIRRLEPDLPIKTFSFIAEQKEFNELKWVEAVNSTVGAEPCLVTINEGDFLRDIDDLILAQGEPFGGTSIYAQYCLFRTAREKGTVVLIEGQGGDELYAGYFGYPGQRLLSILETDGMLSAHRFAVNWAETQERTYQLACAELGRIMLPDRAYALARNLSGRDFQPSWLNLSLLKDANVKFRERRPHLLPANRGRRVVEQLAHSMQQRGLSSLLRHADRNSMRWSMESRVPFLTMDLAELALSLPEVFLVSCKGHTKYVFREAMRGIVPDSILKRTDKIGFAAPEAAWLKTIRAECQKIAARNDVIDSDLSNFIKINASKALLNSKNVSPKLLWRLLNYSRWAQLLSIH